MLLHIENIGNIFFIKNLQEFCLKYYSVFFCFYWKYNSAFSKPLYNVKYIYDEIDNANSYMCKKPKEVINHDILDPDNQGLLKEQIPNVS